MSSKKRSAKAAAKKSSKRGVKETPAVPELVDNDEVYYDEDALDDVLSLAEFAISDFEYLFQNDKVTDDAIEESISKMDSLRDRLEDFADDGWRDYRDTIEEYSNRLWRVGVAWPQFLPPWHVADIVNPDDVKREIRSAWIYEEDFLAIRHLSDVCKLTFKDMVSELVKVGRKKFKG